MTEAQAVEAITAAFDAAWKVAQPTVPIVYDNAVASTAPTWVRMTIVDTTGEQVSMGVKREERSGYIAVQCFAPVNGGRALASSLVDAARQLFRSTPIVQRDGAGNPAPGGDEVITFGGRTQVVGNDKAGAYYVLVAIVPFTYWEMPS